MTGASPALPELLRGSPSVWVAPMAGGPSRPELVVAAAGAGNFAQLAAGYKTVTQLEMEVTAVHASGVGLFGVNLFVPNVHHISQAEYDAYASSLRPTAQRFAMPDSWAPLREDDDEWQAKVDFLVNADVPVVSFTFGLPDVDVISAFRAAGKVTLQTVTSPEEAMQAQALGVDGLLVQGWAAGGHSGVWRPHRLPVEATLQELVRAVRAVTSIPLVAAGGISTWMDVREALHAGAAAVAVGTAVLRTPESGASTLHKTALANPQYTRTTLTRAFTGRPARGLVNQFVLDHDGHAPVGYPALHHLTRPLRAAASRANDHSAINLWAGEGWRAASDDPVTEVLARLEPPSGSRSFR